MRKGQNPAKFVKDVVAPSVLPHYQYPETELNTHLSSGLPIKCFTLRDKDKHLEQVKILPKKMYFVRLWRGSEAWPLLALGSTKLSDTLQRFHRFSLNIN